MKLWIVPLVLLAGCVSTEQDDRICLDYETRTVMREKCIPLYGSLICADEQKVVQRCVLYETIEPVKEKENANEVQTK